jgi:hypothetical protein
MGSWQLFNKNLEQREGRAKDIFGLKPAPIVPNVQRLPAVQSLAAVPCSRFNGVKADARSKGSNRSSRSKRLNAKIGRGELARVISVRIRAEG